MTARVGISGNQYDTTFKATMVQGHTPNVQIYAPANPAGTAVLGAGVMMGLGAQVPPVIYTPIYTGRITVLCMCILQNNTVGDGATALLRIGLVSGGIPANGGAVVGTSIGNQPINGAQPAQSGPIVGNASNLTIGVPWWIDLELAASVGGTATVTKIVITVRED